MQALLTLTLALILLSGCSGNPPQPATPPPAAAPATAPVAEIAPAPAPEPITIIERPFPDDSLYPLLVAEFALRHRDYALALNTYLQQANLLRDAALSAHTTRLAQFLQRDQDALTASELWVELAPANLEARLTLANLLAHASRPRAALPHMEYILRAGGQANFTALARDFDKLSLAAQAELFASVQGLLKEYPQNIQLRLCQSLMLEEKGDLNAALNELQPIFETDASQLQAVILDAKLRLDMGQDKDVFARVHTVLKEQPDNSRLRLQYARLLTRVDLTEAERQFNMLAELAPDDPDLRFSLALIQRETDNLNSARENLEHLLALNERTDEAHYYLGRTAEDQARWEEAVMHYMQVPPGRDFAATTDHLSRLLLAAGRGVELNAWFDHLRQRYPSLVERLYAIEAEQLISNQYPSEAMALLDRGVEEFPSSVVLLYSRAMLAEQLDNLLLSEQDLRGIIALDARNSTALNALGYTLANRTERYLEAADLISRALAVSPQEPAILDSMGWVSYRLGDNTMALNYLRRAYALFPDAEVAAHLGEVLWASGDPEAAETLWRLALATDPDHAVLLETMQRFGVATAAN